MLTDRGMFDNQADAVMQEAIPLLERLSKGYRITWERPASEYPEPIFNVMWLPLRDTALKWIKENAPEAWFRPLFESEAG